MEHSPDYSVGRLSTLNKSHTNVHVAKIKLHESKLCLRNAIRNKRNWNVVGAPYEVQKKVVLCRNLYNSAYSNLSDLRSRYNTILWEYELYIKVWTKITESKILPTALLQIIINYILD